MAQALVWLVFGTIVVVGLAVWISYEATVSSNRNDVREGSADQLVAEGFQAQLRKPYRMADWEQVLKEVKPMA